MQPASNVIAIHPALNNESPVVADSCTPDERGRMSERAMWWFKLTNDCTRNPLIRTIARRSYQPLERVFTVMVALQAEASGAKDRGSVVGFDAETVGDAFDVDEKDIAAIVQALTDRGWIVGGRIADWAKMQPARDEPKSTPRVRAHRERNAAERDATAVKRHETPGSALESELETESEKRQRVSKSNESRSPDGSQVAFEVFWAAWPNKVAKKDAEKAFPAALKRVGGDASKIVAGIETYKAKRPPDQRWMNPAKFLNGDRFNDDPAAMPETDPMGISSHQGLYGLEERKMRRSEHVARHGSNRLYRWRPVNASGKNAPARHPDSF